MKTIQHFLVAVLAVFITIASTTLGYPDWIDVKCIKITRKIDPKGKHVSFTFTYKITNKSSYYAVTHIKNLIHRTKGGGFGYKYKDWPRNFFVNFGNYRGTVDKPNFYKEIPPKSSTTLTYTSRRVQKDLQKISDYHKDSYWSKLRGKGAYFINPTGSLSFDVETVRH